MMPHNRTGLKKALILAAGVAAVAALCTVAVLLMTEPRFEEASRETTNAKIVRSKTQGDEPAEKDPISPEARWYAKDYGVSLEEADRRMDMQGDPFISRLDSKLRKNEGDTYVELRLRHEPDYGITLAFTGDPRVAIEKVKPLAEGTQWEGTIRIDHVELTKTELQSVRAKAERILDRLGIRYDSDEDRFTSRVQLYVADEAKLHRKLRAAGLELPDHVTVREGMAVPMDSAE